jgi:hypothetical protein
MLSHSLSRIIGAVYHSVYGSGIPLIPFRVTIRRIGVSTGCGYCFARRKDAWTNDRSLIDRLAQCQADIILIANISDGCKSRLRVTLA